MTSKIWIIAALAASACVASFENVKATAKLGQKLGEQPIVVSEWVAECEAGHANDGKRDEKCHNHEKDKNYEILVADIRDGSTALQGYAAALQIAANAKDVKIDDFRGRECGSRPVNAPWPAA